MPDMGIEVGFGWQKNSIDAEIKGGDGYFKRTSLAATGVYHFLKKDHLNVYGGLGIGYYMSPELYRKWEGHFETKVKYENASGYHGLIGGSLRGEEWFLFIDTKYVFGVKYKFKEGVENGFRFTTSPFNEWREIDGSGILIRVS